MVMTGLKSRASQRGIGQLWMVLTIGIMVGFVLGFILFLSRLPDEHYTLVETESGYEEYEAAEADQYVFYDSLSESRSAVPNAAANEMPAFTRSKSAGKYGAAVNERPSAVEISDELLVDDDVAPVEVPAAASVAGAAAGKAAVSNAASSGNTLIIRQPTTIKKVRDKPSTSYYLQAGAFANDGDAQKLQARLNQSGMDAFIKKVAIEGKQWHRVRIGPFYDSRSLNTAQNKLGRSGIGYLVIKVQS